MLKIYQAAIFSCLAFFASSQSIQRQSIGCIGGSHMGQGNIQQSVGQPYSTATSNPDHGARQGMIQPLSLEHEELHNSIGMDIMVYPNPTTSSVTFSPEKEIYNCTLSVYNSSGQLINSIETERLKEQTLDCSDWPNGSFFVDIKTETGQRYKSKIVKN